MKIRKCKDEIYFWKSLIKSFLLSVVILFLTSDTVLADVKINEFVVDSSQEWVEFYNTNSSAEYLRDYYIDDDENFLSDSGSSAKKLISNLDFDVSNPTFPVVNLGSISMFNNSGDIVVLFDQDGRIVDSYRYDSNPGRDVSIGRYPDYIGNFYVLSYLTKGDANAAPPTPTPTPTPTLTPTPTPDSNQSSQGKQKATLEIKEARDQDDNILRGSLKIYIDGAYTGNYAPETYIFCDDCKCGTNNIACGFGSHTIKVEKTGYLDWVKTLDISSGNTYEETPILSLRTQPPTSTPKPSATPKVSPSPSPSPSPQTEDIVSSNESSFAFNSLSQPGVLGLESENKDENKNLEKKDPYFNFAAIFFIIAGISFLSAAGYAYFKHKKKGKTKSEFENAESEEAP